MAATPGGGPLDYAGLRQAIAYAGSRSCRAASGLVQRDGHPCCTQSTSRIDTQANAAHACEANLDRLGRQIGERQRARAGTSSLQR